MIKATDESAVDSQGCRQPEASHRNLQGQGRKGNPQPGGPRTLSTIRERQPHSRRQVSTSSGRPRKCIMQILINAFHSGQFSKDCKSCYFQDPIDTSDTGPEIRNKLWCNCESGDDGFVKSASINLDEFMKVQDDGFVKCFDHKSKGSSYKRWEAGRK